MPLATNCSVWASKVAWSANPGSRVSHPVFDMALGQDAVIWATTGGGPLLELDADTGIILAEYGDGLTQSLAIEQATGLIYVSSGAGIEIFDPASDSFTHFSDIRVGNLAFAPNGVLWAASWPDRGDVLRFDTTGHAEVMLRFDSPVDSIAFGPQVAIWPICCSCHKTAESFRVEEAS